MTENKNSSEDAPEGADSQKATWKELGRVAAGLIAIVTLAGLFIGEATGHLTPTIEHYVILLALIQTLLEVDIRRNGSGGSGLP